MSTSHDVPSLTFHTNHESTSSEEDSSSSEEDVPRVVDHNSGNSVLGEEDSSSESSEEHDAPMMMDYSRGNSGIWEEGTSSTGVVRKAPAPMFLTTAQKRTKMNMFGVTSTEFARISIIDPVLYIVLYSTGDVSSEIDEYHWALIVGPSHEEHDSKGTLYSMEPRQAPGNRRPHGGEWCWLYNQTTVPLRGQTALLARLMIAEVADMDILQAIILRWGSKIRMRDHVEWMSVRWVKNILKSLNEEEGCLGRRMESFDSVEDEGRSLAETEEEKRKGFCLLDTRISTRTLFERERATAFLSTATVDIAIEIPVLYIAVYKADGPHQNSKQWAFLIGPSLDTARSEGVRCGVESRLDSNDWPTCYYNQTIVPFLDQDDLLSRFMIAKIRDLAPLGAILRDQDVAPVMERTDTIAGDLETSSFAWLWEKMDIFERNPEYFLGKCTAFRMFEQVDCNVMVDWCTYAVGELAERSRPVYYRKRMQKRMMVVHTKTLNLVDRWRKLEDEEANLVANLSVEREQPSTILRSVQIVTGVLGAAALETRQRVAERKQWKTTGEQEGEAGPKPEGSGNATVSTPRTKLEHANDAKRGSKNIREKEATAELECARVTTTNLVPRKPEKATGEKKVAKNTEKSESTDQEEEARVTNFTAVKTVNLNKPGDATHWKNSGSQDEEYENETESEGEDDNEEEEESDATDDNEEEDEDESEDGEESDASGDSNDDDGSDGDKPKGVAKESIGEKRENARPEGFRGRSGHLTELHKPERASEGKNVANKAGDEIEHEDEGSNDDTEEEEDSEDSDDDSDNNSDDDEEEEEDEDEDDDEDEGDEQNPGTHTTLKRVPALTSSA